MSKEGKPVTMQVKLIGKHHPNQLLPVFGKQQGNKLLEVVRATPIAASTSSQVSTANVLTVCSTAITSTAAVEQPVRKTEGAVTVIQESSALGGNSHTTATALSSISSSEDDNNDSSLLCLDDQVLDF